MPLVLHTLSQFSKACLSFSSTASLSPSGKSDCHYVRPHAVALCTYAVLSLLRCSTWVFISFWREWREISSIEHKLAYSEKLFEYCLTILWATAQHCALLCYLISSTRTQIILQWSGLRSLLPFATARHNSLGIWPQGTRNESAHIMAVAEQKVGELMLSEVTVEEEEDGNFARTSPDAFVL